MGKVEVALAVPAGFGCYFSLEPSCVCVAITSAVHGGWSALEDVDFGGVFGNFWQGLDCSCAGA